MKLYRLIIIAVAILCVGCSDDDEVLQDNLESIGILGEWELSDETVNGITSLLPLCCEFIEFSSDSNIQDFRGLFIATTSQNETSNGVFIIEPNNQTITFQREDRDDLVYGYVLSESQTYITFSFTEGEANYQQGWIKRN